MNFTNIGCNEVTVNWTSGDGFARVLFIREGSNLSEVPEDDVYYSYDSNNPFQNTTGESIKNDGIHWCAYRGLSNSITVKGLKHLTTYYFAVFEYNANGGGKYYYLTSSFASGNVKTKSIIADFKFVPSQQCLNGNSTQFTNLSTTTQSPKNLTYKWDFGDTKTSTQQDPKHTYSTLGIFPVKLVASDVGCTDTVVFFDTIHPHPVANFDLEPTKINNDSVQCFYGNRFTFRNKSTLQSLGNSISYMNYDWSANDTFFVSAYKADKSFSRSGTYKVKLVAISDKNCKDSTYKFYTVLPRAIDPSKVIIDPKAMCLSNNVFKFTNNSPLSISSRWRFGDGGPDSLDGKTVNHSYQKIGKYYITLKAYDTRGCLDVHKDSIEVISNTSVSFTGLAATYCLNDNAAVLKPKPSGGVFFGNNVNAIDSSFRPASIGKFSVGYVYTVGNCKDTAWGNTEVLNRPKVYLGKDTVICVKQPLRLNADPAYVNTWNPGGIGANYLDVSTSGNFMLKSVDGNCPGYDTINIRAIDAPQITHMRDTTLCGGSYLKFDFKVDLGTAFWSDGSNLKNRNVNQSGFYKVVLANKCGTVSDSFNLTVEETACVVFFPNAFTPNGDLLNDVWQPFGKYEFLKMNVFNRWGEKVYFSDKSPVWDGMGSKELCLDGVYSIVFEFLQQDGNSTKRVTKGLVVHLIR